MLALSNQAFTQNNTLVEQRLDSLMQSLETNNKAMASVSVMQNGKLIYHKAIGFIASDAGKNTPSTIATKYRIGSITKMFTSVMILQLAEEQKLSLTDKLSQYFPKVANASKISIEQMLNHHSGIYSFTDDSSYVEWMTEPMYKEQILALIESYGPAFEPGEKGEYSNSNYALLGLILEKVSGKSYEQNLAERITNKLNLTSVKVGDRINHTDNQASSFNYTGKNWIELPETDMSVPLGAGNLISNCSDLTAFITALFDGKLISTESLNKMKTMTDNYGLGLFRFPFYELKGYGHTGGIDGFSSSLSYFPEKGLSVALCSNGLNTSMNDILIGILSICLERPYKIPDFKAFAIAPEALKKYEGSYVSEQIPIGLTVKLENGILTGQGTGQSSFPLEAVSEKEFRFERGGIVMIFDISDQGIVNGFTLKQGGDYIFKREVKP